MISESNDAIAILGKKKKNGQHQNTLQQLETRTRKMDEKWMKNRSASKTDTTAVFEKWHFSGHFSCYFLLVFDSIFQKNKMRNEMKNESKTITVNDTITYINRYFNFFEIGRAHV